MNVLLPADWGRQVHSRTPVLFEVFDQAPGRDPDGDVAGALDDGPRRLTKLGSKHARCGIGLAIMQPPA